MSLSSTMADNFEVDIGAWMDDKRSVVSWVVILSQAGFTVAGPTCLESSGMELSDLLGVWEYCVSVGHERKKFDEKLKKNKIVRQKGN
jgi:hypothetical protein